MKAFVISKLKSWHIINNLLYISFLIHTYNILFFILDNSTIDKLFH